MIKTNHIHKNMYIRCSYSRVNSSHPIPSHYQSPNSINRFYRYLQAKSMPGLWWNLWECFVECHSSTFWANQLSFHYLYLVVVVFLLTHQTVAILSPAGNRTVIVERSFAWNILKYLAFTVSVHHSMWTIHIQEQTTLEAFRINPGVSMHLLGTGRGHDLGSIWNSRGSKKKTKSNLLMQ